MPNLRLAWNEIPTRGPPRGSPFHVKGRTRPGAHSRGAQTGRRGARTSHTPPPSKGRTTGRRETHTAAKGRTLVAYSRQVTGRRRPGVYSTVGPEEAKPAAETAAAEELRRGRTVKRRIPFSIYKF